MKKLLCLLGLVILPLGCALVSAELRAPKTVVAMVSEPEWTGWWRDYCQAGALTPSQPECLQSGGLVLRVKLTNIRTLDGKRIEGTAFIALPGPQFAPHYRAEKEIQLRASPSEFFEATGIEFYADDWKGT